MAATSTTGRGAITRPDLFFGQMGGSIRYAPCGLEELVAKGYDYRELGHVHKGQALSEHPHVEFPGNLQVRHVRGAGPKATCLASVEMGEVVDATTMTFDAVRCTWLEVELAAARSKADMIDLIRRALAKGVASADDGGWRRG